MKSKLLILSLLLWVGTFAQSVPNSAVLSLRNDVYPVVHSHAPSTIITLNSVKANAVDTYYDPAYKGDKSSQLNFRNYTINNLVIGSAYQGGVIGYIFQSGDPGYVSGEIHGIICATSDQSSGCAWGTVTTSVSTSNNLYTAQSNTNNIITVNGSGSYAAKLCADYSVTVDDVVYSDWWLPSYAELNYICINKALIGGFVNANYWTSSQSTDDISQAFIRAFIGCADGDAIKTGTSIRVRAIRYF